MDTLQRLIAVFNAVFETDLNSDSVSNDTTLREDLSINSIGMLYVAMALEEEFGIKFKNEDLKDIKTVGDVIAVVESKVV